jgi:GT2 family glycosyltransferase
MSAECAICIPARNEEERLPVLLAALARQDVPGLRVVVVANNCNDGTAEAARRFADREPRLRLRVRELDWRPGLANVGRARGAAMAAGAAWLREEAGDGILVSTDADASPPPHWVHAILDGFREGAEVVGGEIRIAEDPGWPAPDWLRCARAEVAAYWSAVRDLAHGMDPLPHDPPARHGDHTGASLAVTIAAYEAAGGIPPLAVREDVALVEAVERNGGRVRHPVAVWTEVSAREDGRAEGGMATEMRKWRCLAEGGKEHLQPGAGFWYAAFNRRRALREMFRRGTFHGWDGLPASACEALARRSVNDIAFVAACEAMVTREEPEMAEIGRATRDLRAMMFTNLAA